MEAHLGLTELYQASGNVTAALKHYDEIFKVCSCARACVCMGVIGRRRLCARVKVVEAVNGCVAGRAYAVQLEPNKIDGLQRRSLLYHACGTLDVKV